MPGPTAISQRQPGIASGPLGAMAARETVPSRWSCARSRLEEDLAEKRGCVGVDAEPREPTATSSSAMVMVAANARARRCAQFGSMPVQTAQCSAKLNEPGDADADRVIS